MKTVGVLGAVVRHISGVGLSAALLLTAVSAAISGPERIQFSPWDNDGFVFLRSVDKRDRDRPVIRFIYINREAAETAKLGEPLPLGTKVIMPERVGASDSKGQPLLDDKGRFVPTTEISKILVGEKQDGWGASYAEAERIGDWEFAVFGVNGKLLPDIDYAACRSCHSQAVTYDYTFSIFPSLSALKR